MKLATILVSIILSISCIYAQDLKIPSLESQEFTAYFSDKSNVPKVNGKVSNLPSNMEGGMSVTYHIVRLDEKLQETKIAEVNPDGTFGSSRGNSIYSGVGGYGRYVFCGHCCSG